MMDIFEIEGNLQTVGSNTPILLNDPEKVYFVVDGQVDVFAVQVKDHVPTGPRTYVSGVTAGEALFGADGSNTDFALLAVGGVGTQLCCLPTSQLQHAPIDQVVGLIDQFLLGLGQAVACYIHPQLEVLLSANRTFPIEAGRRAGSTEEVVWVMPEGGDLHFAGSKTTPLPTETDYFPLPEGVWVVSPSNMELHCVTTHTALMEGGKDYLNRFVNLFLFWLAQQIHAQTANEQDRLTLKIQAEHQVQQKALQSLAEIMVSTPIAAPIGHEEDPVFAALQAVGETQGIVFRQPPHWQKVTRASDRLRVICQASAVRYRKVILRDAWWQADTGPLVCFLSNDGNGTESVVAALPVESGGYVLFNPADGTQRPLNVDVAVGLEPHAYVFYRPLPGHLLGLSDLWRYIRRDLLQDVRTLIWVGGAGAILGLVMPVMTGFLFDTVIPSANRGKLWEMFVGLLVATLAGALFELTRSFALLRMETKANASLQMAIVDRLLRLPLRFFRQFSAGDLAERVGGINEIRQIIGGAMLTSIMTALVSLGNFALLFYYSAKLALLATGILILNVAVTAVFAYFSVYYLRQLKTVAGKLSGFVFQLLNGIGKLRVSGAESRAFAVWSGHYREQKRLTFEAGRFENFQQVFNSFMPIVSTLVLFAMMASVMVDPQAKLSTGRFLAFNAAYGTFLTAMVALTGTLINLLNIIPSLERARPILETIPEVDASKPDPGELEGRLEISHVRFRYQEDSPLILDDVSFYADPGEFIAFVGPSGAGKSTLLRILLGFDMPESGSVYYDGQDIALVDVSSVRQQVGIVLQSSKLSPGSIFENMTGVHASLTMDEAWQAARMAGLEADIRAMPMGMHTVIGEGGSTFSGGQRQRLLIARALATKPRLVFFDEATSALDNRTQQVVSESLAQLDATRIVIAHRLSTIQQADRIYVMAQGKVVQVGTFDELSEQPGLFADMANRQMV